MKSIYITTATAFLLSTIALLGEQTSAFAGQERLTPAQINRLSRDLLPTTPSQDFFQQGRQRIERELFLNRRENAASTEPPLKINVDTQAEINRLPQLQPTDLQQTQPK